MKHVFSNFVFYFTIGFGLVYLLKMQICYGRFKPIVVTITLHILNYEQFCSMSTTNSYFHKSRKKKRRFSPVTSLHTKTLFKAYCYPNVILSNADTVNILLENRWSENIWY
jgi:hypothetical protein